MVTEHLALGGLPGRPSAAGPAPEDVVRGAQLSADGQYRYWLSRRWRTGRRRVCWTLLNPSEADAEHDDPTVTLMMRYSYRWGFDEMWVLNAYALISPDPAVLTDHPDPIGPENDKWLAMAGGSELVVVAWGASAGQRGVDLARWMLEDQRIDLHCLGLTKGGAPVHPLRKRTDLELVKFRVPGEAGEVACWHCVTPGMACLDELNRSGVRCCDACGLSPAHQPASPARTAPGARAAQGEVS